MRPIASVSRIVVAALLILTSGGRVASADDNASASSTVIDLPTFEKMKDEPDTVVVDVRTEKEFADGHVPGAVNVPVQAEDFKDKVGRLAKDKRYLVYCAVGVRSTRAVTSMEKLGFGKLFNFTGGMKAWAAANKPVEKK